MRRSYMILAFLLATLFVTTSCGERKGVKYESTGKPYEVVVVIPSQEWKSQVGDTLKSVLLERVDLLNQKEPHFDVVPVIPSAFKNLMQRHRNIIMVNIGSEYPEPAIVAAYDVYAQPQIIMEVSGPNDSTVTDFIWQRRDEIQKVIDFAERDRYVASITKQTNQKINDEIFEKFGFRMSIPKEYKVRNSQDDFMWISYELRVSSQGIVIYSYPYTGKSDFELDSLISKRNQFVSKIPGEVDKTHMGTTFIEGEMEPELRHVRIDGRFWAELSGFWEVKGDFMGGPFRSYSTLDVANRRVVCIDTYAFAPNLRKRNYVRQLENLIYTVKFSDTTPQTSQADGVVQTAVQSIVKAETEVEGAVAAD